MTQDATWYFAIDGKQQGPFTKADLRGRLERGEIDGSTYVYTPGMADWAPIGNLGGFTGDARSAPPPPPVGRRSDVIDYEIYGEEMQFVEITLDPGEAASRRRARSCTWIRASRWRRSSGMAATRTPVDSWGSS